MAMIIVYYREYIILSCGVGDGRVDSRRIGGGNGSGDIGDGRVGGGGGGDGSGVGGGGSDSSGSCGWL